MRSPNREVSECPDGYRRYVYRINIKPPFEIKFPADTRKNLPDDVKYDPSEAGNEDGGKMKKGQDEEQKTT